MPDDIAIAAMCSAVVAICQLLGTLSTNRRIREVHDCLDQHIEESRHLHSQTQEKVAIVAVTDDKRDIRNTGTAAIISGEASDAKPGS